MVVGQGQGKAGCDQLPIINHPGKHSRGVETSDRGYWSVENGPLLNLRHEKSECVFGRDLVIWRNTRQQPAVIA